MPKYTKIDRTELVDYLNITPTADTPTWAVIGQGITDKSTDYNANVTTEKFIINKNANSTVDSYELSSGVEQTCYKGDEEFEFVDKLRYNLATSSDADTQLLEIDKYSYTESSGAVLYRARLFDVTIEISSNGGDTAKINYTIHYNGDPTLGTVTFTDGVPTFTETA